MNMINTVICIDHITSCQYKYIPKSSIDTLFAFVFEANDAAASWIFKESISDAIWSIMASIYLLLFWISAINDSKWRNQEFLSFNFSFTIFSFIFQLFYEFFSIFKFHFSIFLFHRNTMAKHHSDLVLCRKLPGVGIYILLDSIMHILYSYWKIVWKMYVDFIWL